MSDTEKQCPWCKAGMPMSTVRNRDGALLFRGQHWNSDPNLELDCQSLPLRKCLDYRETPRG